MKIGLAMFTVRNEMVKDPMGTLEKIAQMGYKSIELANLSADVYPESPDACECSTSDLKNKADELGIKITGNLVLCDDFKKMDNIIRFFEDLDLMKRLAEYTYNLGGDHMSLALDFYPDKDYLMRRCALYNEIGNICKEAGLRFYYHNHYHEFQFLGDECMYDLIMENTDPDLMGIELDAYWTFRSGLDPVAIMKKYGKRVEMLHVKDFPFDQARYLDSWTMADKNVIVDSVSYHEIIRPEFFIELGDGMIKIQDIIDTGNELGVKYMFLEQDYTAMPSELESSRRSIENMKRMRGLDWD